MTPRTVFRICFGMNLHFTSEKYSVLKYGTDTEKSNLIYTDMSQASKYRFEWLASKYVSNKDLMYAIIGCQFDDVSIQYDIKSDIHDSYIKYKARRESMGYNLKNELSKYEDLKDKSYEKVIFKYFTGEYSPELLLLLDTDGKLEHLHRNSNFIWAKHKILKLIKYQDFFKVDQYKHLLENISLTPS